MPGNFAFPYFIEVIPNSVEMEAVTSSTECYKIYLHS